MATPHGQSIMNLVASTIPTSVQTKRPIITGPIDQPAPKKGRKKGAKNFSATEIEMLLDIVKEILPYGANHWEEVA